MSCRTLGESGSRGLTPHYCSLLLLLCCDSILLWEKLLTSRSEHYSASSASRNDSVIIRLLRCPIAAVIANYDDLHPRRFTMHSGFTIFCLLALLHQVVAQFDVIQSQQNATNSSATLLWAARMGSNSRAPVLPLRGQSSAVTEGPVC